MTIFDMAGHLIRRLHQQSTYAFAQRTQAAGFDLTAIQYAALEAICSHPATDQARVAELIGYDRATIGGVIDRLEKKGWISRVVSDRDRRARELTLTVKGNRVLAALQPIVQGVQQDILHPLNDAERECFVNLARKIVWQDADALSTESTAEKSTVAE